MKNGNQIWKTSLDWNLIHLDSNGKETYRLEGFKFTAKDPKQYADALRGRFPSDGFLKHGWVATKIEDLIDLDA